VVHQEPKIAAAIPGAISQWGEEMTSSMKGEEGGAARSSEACMISLKQLNKGKTNIHLPLERVK